MISKRPLLFYFYVDYLFRDREIHPSIPSLIGVSESSSVLSNVEVLKYRLLLCLKLDLHPSPLFSTDTSWLRSLCPFFLYFYFPMPINRLRFSRRIRIWVVEPRSKGHNVNRDDTTRCLVWLGIWTTVYEICTVSYTTLFM